MQFKKTLEIKADHKLMVIDSRYIIFPGMELYENYPLLVKHKFLIPVYWFYRIVRLLFSKKRRNHILREVKAVKKIYKISLMKMDIR